MNRIFDLSKNDMIFLKGIAIFFVLMGHFGYIYNAGSWGVSLFLMLSGYGIFKSYKSNNNKYYFEKKIKKVYLPYLLVTVVTLAYYIYFSGNNLCKDTIFFSLLGLDFNVIYDKTMWYISFIFIQYFIFYISCYFSNFLSKKNADLMIIIFCFIFGILILFFSKNSIVWGSEAGVFLYCYSFPVGVLFSKLSFVKINKYIKLSFMIFLCIYFSFIILFLYGNINNIQQYFIYANTMPILLLLLNEFKIFNVKNKFINFLGKYSFDIYLWEGFVLLNYEKWIFNFEVKLISGLLYLELILFVAYYYRKIIINPLLNFFDSDKLLI